MGCENMEHFRVRIAGNVAAVSAQFGSTVICCSEYICESEPDFSVSISSSDIMFENDVADREREIEDLPCIIIDDFLLEQTALQRKIAEGLFEYGTVLFHGSVISVDGEGYLFTAKSGTGKSTHTRLWREMLGDRAVMVNDDKPFLQVREGCIQVYGSPWNGKHGLGNNIDVPLKAICILERSEKNEISQISAKEAVPMLLQQSNRPQNPQLLLKYLEIIDNISHKTTFYRLKCNMEPEAAEISYQTMSGKLKEN